MAQDSIQLAMDAVAEALKSVNELDEIVQENVRDLEMLKVYIAELDKAHERLDEARHYHLLQLIRVAAEEQEEYSLDGPPQKRPRLATRKTAYQQDLHRPMAILSSLSISDADEFLAQEGLLLSRYDDAFQFLRYKMQAIAPYDDERPYHAEFSNDCLEDRLDQRLTHYNPDNINDIKVLLAVSGAGKTRLLLELLYARHGYYFVCKKDQIDFGSDDLMICRRFTEKNPLISKYYIGLLYFVRSEVCKYLMELGYQQPYELLLAQLHPMQFFGGTDVFAELFTFLASCASTIQTKLVGCFDFAVIDEIQATMKGETVYGNNRPFFTPLVYQSKMFGSFPLFMVAGTEMNFKYLNEFVQSSAFKESELNHQLVACFEPEPTAENASVSHNRFK